MSRRYAGLSLVAGVVFALGMLLFGAGRADAQVVEYRWVAGGILHNWYSNMGSEIEEGWVKEQQYGLRWPAYRTYQDNQAAKGIWIAATNFTDTVDGKFYTHKIVHLGPRVDGKVDGYTPKRFEIITKFALPEVYVDGNSSEAERNMTVKSVDPTIVPDVMLINEVATPLGLTYTRRIMQFSQQYHDNYIISDYTFKNTGSKGLTGVYFYFQFRLAVNEEACYVIGNATRWGINEMLDTRGDGVKQDADDSVSIPGVYSAPHMRIQYAWHGKYPPFTRYDNIGAPIWSSPYWDPADTIGRLAGAAFVGVATLHCDRASNDPTDDFSQPSTTSWVGSDEPYTSKNDQFNGNMMTGEYTQWITRGHDPIRHADKVGTGDPALGTPGGFSNANGYGPYTIAPGDSIRLVWAEGASGLNQDQCISVGRKYKAGLISAQVKNDSVLTGKDSLFWTFRRALANFKGGYNIPQPPLPPKSFNVNSGGDKITLTWDVYGTGPAATGFRIYRAVGKASGQYTMIYEAGPGERSFEDTSPVRGVAYYYYILSVGSPADNNGAGLTPAGPLVSNRIWSQTYDPAFLKRPAGNAAGKENMDTIRIVPNPYSLRRTAGLSFPDEPDKIVFFNVPGNCTIRIYTEMGELVNTIEHTDGSGDAYWNSNTSSGQVIVSGIYIVVIDNNTTGQRVIKKLSVIR